MLIRSRAALVSVDCYMEGHTHRRYQVYTIQGCPLLQIGLTGCHHPGQVCVHCIRSEGCPLLPPLHAYVQSTCWAQASSKGGCFSNQDAANGQQLQSHTWGRQAGVHEQLVSTEQVIGSHDRIAWAILQTQSSGRGLEAMCSYRA